MIKIPEYTHKTRVVNT